MTVVIAKVTDTLEYQSAVHRGGKRVGILREISVLFGFQQFSLVAVFLLHNKNSLLKL
jgi:hypothetical protein